MAGNHLVFRSIGVPDVVSDGNRVDAAAHRLASAAGLDVSADPRISDVSLTRLADAGAVVNGAIDAVDAGNLDEVIGGYGYRDDQQYAARLIQKLDIHHYENAQACALMLIQMVRSFVDAHPFSDDVGRPFK